MDRFLVARRVAIAGVCGIVVGCGGGGGDVPLGNAGTPTISGTPPSSAVQGNLYSFKPSASDPDGNSLTFSIDNLPRWATFDAANGQLRGTPAPADVGNYQNIRISVSDGRNSASLSPFTINVLQGGNGSTLVSWNPPTTFVDGSVFSSIAGYRVYYGRGNGDFTNRVSVPNAGATSQMIEGLAPGTWHFVVTVISSEGEESDFSEVATKVIS